ncbi:MAG: Fic family protein [Sheuella sp.]|nr:Fic family protein [Sheuella sp.]
MNSGNKLYIWQQDEWPGWRYSHAQLMPLLGQVHQNLGSLAGRMRDQGISSQSRVNLEALTLDAVMTSEIEGEFLDYDTVRSSVAKHLGLDIGGLLPEDRHVEGVVDMILDATANHEKPLTPERLHTWHKGLFPFGRSDMSSISTGAWRTDQDGPMQVISGPVHRRRVHFEAPHATRLDGEIKDFLSWFETSDETDPILKAALAHLWFVTIHPYDDGNGRMARAISDLALARADLGTQRFYSVSAQIQKERNAYYGLLEKTQKGNLEVTEWLSWFLSCLLRALQYADATLTQVLSKANFWHRWSEMPFNERQIKVLNLMLHDFQGKLTNKKWSALCKCSSDTALRDINELLTRGVLAKSESGGRSTSYTLVIYPQQE